jgi:hypothetical protein
LPSVAPLAAWGAIAAAATLVNPRGYEVYGYVANLLRHPSMSRVVEWGTTSRVLPFMTLAMGLLVLASKKRPTVTELLVLVAMIALGFQAARSAMWAGAIAAVVLAAPVAEWLRFDGASPMPFGRAIVAVAAILVALRSPLGLGRVVLEDTPVAAVDALRALGDARPKRLFASEGTGSYMMWAAPEQKTFVDTRIELYPPAHWDTWAEIERAEDVDRVVTLLDQNGVDGVLASKEHERALVTFLTDRASWGRRYEDADWVIFARSPPPGSR